MKYKVLVVDDDLFYNARLSHMLRHDHFSVYACTDLASARLIFTQERPDIVLTDLHLPSGSGLKLLPLFCRNPHVFLVAMAENMASELKAESFELGADDVIVKPCDFLEIRYKFRAIRRRLVKNTNEFRIGDIVCDLSRQTLHCRGQSTLLPKSQAALLHRLFQAHVENDWIRKDDPRHTHDIARLHTAMGRLRKNLSRLDSRLVEIETLYGQGYKLKIHQESSP